MKVKQRRNHQNILTGCTSRFESRQAAKAQSRSSRERVSRCTLLTMGVRADKECRSPTPLFTTRRLLSLVLCGGGARNYDGDNRCILSLSLSLSSPQQPNARPPESQQVQRAVKFPNCPTRSTPKFLKTNPRFPFFCPTVQNHLYVINMALSNA